MVRTFAFACVAAAALLSLTACSRSKEPAPEASCDVAALIARLQDPDKEKKKAAEKDLDELGTSGKITADVGVALIRAATSDFHDGDSPVFPTGLKVLYTVRDSPHAEYIEPIREVVSALDADGKEAALQVLAEIPETEATRAFLDLALEHSAELNRVPLSGFEREPRHADLLFPRILDLMRREELASDIHAMTLKYVEAGALSRERLAQFGDRFVGEYARAIDRVRRLQKAVGSDWIWEGDYLVLRFPAEVLADLLGYLPAGQVEPLLRESLNLYDPRIVLFAAVSLIRIGSEVPGEVLLRVAASAETRNSLHDLLKELGRADRFPAEYRTQEAFAESDMVGWLTYPTELARVPDEIELMKVVTHGAGSTEAESYYLFRFRSGHPDWAEKGWMSGVAGPYLRREMPTTRAGGGTFSSFRAWESMTPDEHAADLAGTVEEWYEQRGEQ